MATLVLRTVKGVPLTNAEVDGNFSNINTDVGVVYNTANTINSNIGVLSNLTTTAKSNIVAAINEIAAESTSNVYITGGTITGTTGWSGNTISIAKGGTNQTAFTSPASSVQGLVFFNGTSLANDSNVYHIGYNDTTSTFYANIISTTGDITSGGVVSAVDFNSTSDETLKDNIINPLAVLDQLSGKEFTWKSNGNKAYGLIAQDVEQVLPAIVSNNNGHKGINYINIIAFLVEAVKELSAEINILKQK